MMLHLLRRCVLTAMGAKVFNDRVASAWGAGDQQDWHQFFTNRESDIDPSPNIAPTRRR